MYAGIFIFFIFTPSEKMIYLKFIVPLKVSKTVWFCCLVYKTRYIKKKKSANNIERTRWNTERSAVSWANISSAHCSQVTVCYVTLRAQRRGGCWYAAQSSFIPPQIQNRKHNKSSRALDWFSLFIFFVVRRYFVI